MSNVFDVRRRMCGKKVGHPSQAKAYKERARMLGEHGEVLGVYHCPFCGKWHLGHQRPSKGKMGPNAQEAREGRRRSRKVPRHHRDP